MFQGPSTNGGKSKSSGLIGSTQPTAGSTAVTQVSTPPASTVTQQPQVQQHQQPPPQHYTYAPSHQTYTIPMFQMLGNSHQSHHPHGHPHGLQSNAAGGNAAGASGQQGASLSIDPNLSAMSDAGEGISEDEDGVEAVVGGAGSTAPGVKQGPPSTSAGNNGQPPSLDEDDYQHGDQGDGQGQGGPGDMSMEMHTVLDENGQPVKKKRRRQALSCTECKRRKIKCDRQNPCNPCTRRGEADRCHWVTQEPIEKFVTRGEYELLQSRVSQLEGILAAIAPRTFIPGLEHLNLPLGPPPFGFHPQHHPYPPGQGPPEGHYHPGEVPPPPPVATLQDLHRAYQQQLQAYANAAAQVQAPKPQDVSMEVDANQTQGHLRPVIPTQEHAQEVAKEKPAKGRKRKDRVEGEDVGEEKAAGKARGKGRTSKAGAQHDQAALATLDAEPRVAEEGMVGQ